jgi:nucleotide-binding universal stress UspA family protein
MILFVREGQRGVVDSRTGQITLARALIPVDASPAAAVAVRRACAFLDQLGVTVEKRLLHIGDAPPPNCPKDIPMTLAQGPVGEAILQTAARFGADLIVMPTAGKRGLLSAFRDSLSARILDDARWPVLSVPAIEAD